MFQCYLFAVFALVIIWWPMSYLLQCVLHKRRIMKVLKNMHTIDDYPIIGCALRFYGKDNEGLMEVIKDNFFSHPTPFVAWLGTKSFVVVDHPEDIQVIVNSKNCIEKGNIYRFFNRAVGLFAAPAHIWKPQRKQLSKSFNNQITWSFLPIFNKHANVCVRTIGQYIGTGAFDLMHHSSACALDIVCESVMGTPVNVQNGENTDYMEALSQWLSTVALRMMNVFLHPDLIYKRTQLYQTECDWLARAEVMPEKVIKQKIMEFNGADNNNDATFDNEDEAIEKPQIFIDRLLKLRSKGVINDQGIRDQVNLMIFGGHDTSAFTIAMTTLLLAMHANVEQRLIDELDQVFHEQPIEADITMEQVNQLVYLEQIIKETLRLYPVAPIFVRHCTEDTQLPEYTIPAGTEVVVSVMTAQRRKDVWGDDADEFNPDHFSKENCSKRNPYAFSAFSNGSRSCIAQRFAFVSMKVVLAKMFRKYQFSTQSNMKDIKFRLEITCKPVNGVMVQIEPRNKDNH